MALSQTAALWFLPFVLPLCYYVAFTDLREMRITNQAVIALAVVYLVVGPFVLPLPDYGMGVIRMAVMLVIGILLNAGGAMGAGDAKFIAAAAGFIAPPDMLVVIMILCASTLAAFTTHRLAKHTGLRQIAPHWKSWSTGQKFPMGLCLGATLALYLILAALLGQ
ncbi:prepilin peptidase [Primorskyibacter sp. S87]|uniref:prepilin peptidase n=1 Tax=Primorskyibacter sp. S87 TaxID=3415126 RepID=UPI003C7E524F